MNLYKTIFGLLLGRRLPATRGSAAVTGIKGSVRIDRDRWGIPSITASSDEDAWFGLGYCHGQDRTFQLEAMLRVIRGTLSELVGPDVLPIDRFSRRIGFRRAAIVQARVLEDRFRRQMDAYARGVTAGGASFKRPPHEFALLRSAPTPWTLEDATGVLSLQSFSLASNWDSEMARLRILTADGPEALRDLDPTYPEWQGVASPPGTKAGKSFDHLADEMSAFLAVAARGGSNNCAVNARRTSAGRPLLANDPHLPPTLPPHWYLARVSTPDWTVAGASFAGTPTFPAAHNGYAAWGVTVGLVDNTDLYLEEVAPDGQGVREADGWVRCQVVEEEIRVKGVEEPEKLSVLITPRGPIIGPALDGETQAISIQAVWLEPRPLRGLLDVHRCRSFEQFHKVWELWPALSLNMVYADKDDNIGWQLTGTAPVRRSGHGILPQPAWKPNVGWTPRSVPFEEMPYTRNPKLGLIATANANPTAEPEPFLGVDWIEGYRQDRAVELLAAREDWDVAGFASMQADVASTPWMEVRGIVLAAPAGDPRVARAIDLLSAWDGKVSADSAAASVFELWQAEMVRRVCRAKAPKSWEWAAGKGFTLLSPFNVFHVRRTGHLVRLLRSKPAGWFQRSWDEEVADALAWTVAELERSRGTAVERWAWGQVRPLTLVHPIGARKPMDRIFNLGPMPWGGDQNTVAQAAVDPLAPTSNPGYIQSMLMVVDLGKFEDSRWTLPGGQSGNPLSPHYDDQLPLWQRYEGIPIPYSAEEVAAARVRTLELTPA